MRKALFLDLDGTVRGCLKKEQLCPNKLNEQFILPKVKDKVWAYKNDGYAIVGVTNQGGVGLGYLSADTCQAISAETNLLLKGVFDRIYEAMAKPADRHYWTKPNPGMIEKAADDLHLDLENSIMVGDRESDMKASRAAGVGQFIFAKEFFGWSDEEEAQWKRKD